MPEQETNTNTTANTTPSGGSSSVVGYIIGAIVLILIAGGLWWYFGMGGMNKMNNDNATGNESTSTADTIDTNYPDVVATVNGEDITGDELAANVQQTAQTAKQQGLDPTKAEVRQQIETQALTSLINTKLLAQAAAKADITASDEEIDAQLTQLTNQLGGEDKLQEQLDNAGITKEQLRTDISQQIVLNAYVEQNTDVSNIEVTDQEITDFYNSVTESADASSSVPTLEDVKPQIKQQLLSQKQQAAVNELIQKLRADADIQTMI